MFHIMLSSVDSRLKVSMQYFLIMTMSNPSQQLVREALDDHRIHALFLAIVSHKFFEVIFQILKHQDELAISMDDFSKSYYVGMGQFLENRYLTNSG